MIVWASGGTAAMLVSPDAVAARRAAGVALLALLGAIVVMACLPFIGNEVKGAARWMAISGRSACSRPSSPSPA
jgi:cell division protein FtsW